MAITLKTRIDDLETMCSDYFVAQGGTEDICPAGATYIKDNLTKDEDMVIEDCMDDDTTPCRGAMKWILEHLWKDMDEDSRNAFISRLRWNEVQRLYLEQKDLTKDQDDTIEAKFDAMSDSDDKDRIYEKDRAKTTVSVGG